jgi:hypothetical protein
MDCFRGDCKIISFKKMMDKPIKVSNKFLPLFFLSIRRDEESNVKKKIVPICNGCCKSKF